MYAITNFSGTITFTAPVLATYYYSANTIDLGLVYMISCTSKLLLDKVRAVQQAVVGMSLHEIVSIRATQQKISYHCFQPLQLKHA